MRAGTKLILPLLLFASGVSGTDLIEEAEASLKKGSHFFIQLMLMAAMYIMSLLIYHYVGVKVQKMNTPLRCSLREHLPLDSHFYGPIR